GTEATTASEVLLVGRVVAIERRAVETVEPWRSGRARRIRGLRGGGGARCFLWLTDGRGAGRALGPGQPGARHAQIGRGEEREACDRHSAVADRGTAVEDHDESPFELIAFDHG